MKINIRNEIKLARENFIANNFNLIMLVDYFANRKTYHTIAIMIFGIVTNSDDSISAKYIYSNSFYKSFENESNPFNDDFING